MKKTTLLTIITICLSLTACHKKVKPEAYLDTTDTPPLKAAGSNDLPNTNNSLDIPKANVQTQNTPNDRPPAMPFARKRNRSETVIISEKDGFPTIELYNKANPWELMIADYGENWQLKSDNAEDCQVNLIYNDPINRELSEQGFFRRFFSGKTNHKDLSGEYQLHCKIDKSRRSITLKTAAGKAPASYVTDELFNHIFNAATKDTEDPS